MYFYTDLINIMYFIAGSTCMHANTHINTHNTHTNTPKNAYKKIHINTC